ncbi:hypothetical protein KUTeg_024637 [Tegillarca granosa]|uniref:Uncharacterized protein n=1 Tax=Tegillarca granosa TaxID=220873 RepID=A0ABQ9E318_TEGGR|nr:hypothetical protein KUTeg_024637 [Tegillarca granosa]
MSAEVNSSNTSNHSFIIQICKATKERKPQPPGPWWTSPLRPKTVKQFKDSFQQNVTLREKMNLSEETENHIYASLDAIVAAGIDTTATMIDWAVLFIALYPDIQCKIQKEIDNKIGDRKPTYSDRFILPYTFSAMQEVLRMTTIVPLGLPHFTTKDVALNGFFIPKGTVVFPNLYAVSPGRRRCLGEFLAKAAIFVVFTTLLQKIAGLRYSLYGELGTTHKPHDYQVKIQHRNV